METNYYFCFLLFLTFNTVSASKILGLFPHFGKSHFLVFEPLLEELARKGHEVTVVSFFPKAVPLTNYKDVNISKSSILTETQGFLEFSLMENRTETAFRKIMQLNDFGLRNEKILTEPEVRELLKRKFDLIIIEMFHSDLLFGLAYKFDAPIVGISSHVLTPWHSDILGNPDIPSVIPSMLSRVSDRMTFSDRFVNTLNFFLTRFLFHFYVRPQVQFVAEKHLQNIPPIEEIAKNTSILLINTHFSLFRSRPLLPSIIEVGGIHFKTPRPLPHDLKKIMDESNGVVYFCMGSVLKGDSLSEQKQKAFIKVFSELKLTVLWKREAELEKKVDNIVTSSWFPQRDVLAHPKVRLFISHCGLLGTNEAIASAVPMIGIPMFGDQHHNAKAIESIGVGIYLDFNELNEDVIRNAVHTVLNDPSYKENANKVSAAFLDRPMSPLDTAVYWVEYVIRHKGAPHLRSAARDLTWYEYHNLDVLLIFLIILYVTFLILKTTVKLIIYLIKPMFGSKKVKVN